MNKSKSLTVVLLMSLAATFNLQAQTKKDVANAKKQLQEIMKANKQVESNLVKFDTLDFVVFSNQQWQRLHESHDKNIKVVMPDGTSTVGLDAHIQTLAWMFMFAPDTKIKEHPIRFGSGNYTCVTGYMEGSFTQPMMMQDGTKIPPTGKSFKLSMCTVGIWKDGVMIEEQLFWDNQSFMKQLGLAK
jgi:hypothetical protein